MKFLKISITALSMGIFITSCNNNAHCPPSTTDSASVSAGTANPGSTGASVNATSPDSNETVGDEKSASAENGTGTNTMAASHKNGKYINGKYAHTKDSTMANARKREGNFTSGTGADNPGK